MPRPPSGYALAMLNIPRPESTQNAGTGIWVALYRRGVAEARTFTEVTKVQNHEARQITEVTKVG